MVFDGRDAKSINEFMWAIAHGFDFAKPIHDLAIAMFQSLPEGRLVPVSFLKNAVLLRIFKFDEAKGTPHRIANRHVTCKIPKYIVFKGNFVDDDHS